MENPEFRRLIKSSTGIRVTCPGGRGRLLTGLTLTKLGRDGWLRLAVVSNTGTVYVRRLPAALLRARGDSVDDERLEDFAKARLAEAQRAAAQRAEAASKKSRDAPRGNGKSKKKKRRRSQATSSTGPSSNTPVGGPAPSFAGRQRVTRTGGRGTEAVSGTAKQPRESWKAYRARRSAEGRTPNLTYGRGRKTITRKPKK